MIQIIRFLLRLFRSDIEIYTDEEINKKFRHSKEFIFDFEKTGPNYIGWCEIVYSKWQDRAVAAH